MNKYLFILLFFIPNEIWAQAYYMHEAAEDSDGSPLGGIVSLLLICGIIYLVEKYRSSVKEVKEAKKEEKQKRDVATSVSKSTLDKHENISVFQNKTAWRKGYINATYDIQNNKSRKLYNKSIDDLIKEYHIKRSLDNTLSDKIMEEIGYFEHLDYNNKGLIKAGRKPFKYIAEINR